MKYITDDILNIGVYDKDIDLFENQYRVEKGVTYNSYLIKDKKIAILDTVDNRKKEEYIKNLKEALGKEQPTYLIISHVEPDHTGAIGEILKLYPNICLVGNSKTFAFLEQYYDISKCSCMSVTENTVLDLGCHKLSFYMAPMVHWPEVMVEYDSYSKTLFSADAFGRFGDDDEKEPWDESARRYYYNIVGKYGVQVNAILNKLLSSNIEIEIIAPLHGPVLKEPNKYIEKYVKWCNYESDLDEIPIFCDSIHENTYIACKYLEDSLKGKNINVNLYDLARYDISYAIAKAFSCKTIVLASSTFNMNVFVHMDQLINLLKDKNFQKTNIGLIENGTWSPNAINTIKQILGSCKDITFLEPQITLRGALKQEDKEKIDDLTKSLVQTLN